MKGNKRWKQLFYVLACIFIFGGFPSIDTYAGEIQQQPELIAEEAEGMEEAPEPERNEPEHEKTSYTKNVFFGKTVLQGMFSNSSLYFYVPEYWDTKYVYVQLEYKVSQVIHGITSTMTVSVNEVPVSSCKLAYEEDGSQIMYVEIPLELVQTGYNVLTVSAFARISDVEGCTDSFSDANWLSISDTSYIQSGYELKDHGRRISGYPYPFLSTLDDTGKGLTIAVSDKAANEEIAAAMCLTADLSAETEGENNIRFSLYSDIAKVSTNRTILVSELNNLPEECRRKLDEKTVEAAEKEAIVFFTEDDRKNPLLIITSASGDCLMDAVRMLMDEERVSQERDSAAIIKAGGFAEDLSADRTAADRYTIEELVGGGLNFTGPFHQEQVVYLPFADACYSEDSSEISLQFRYSDNLDFNRSLITVYWGNIPIVSKKLERDKTDKDELTFSIPEDAGTIRTGSMKIAFELEIPDMVCTFRQDQIPWAYISGESSLYLPLSDKMKYSFDNIPLPFIQGGRPDDILMVVSDAPTTNELSHYAGIISMYGDNMSPYGTLYVKRCSEFNEEEGDYNIIVAGTYQDNSLIQKLNPYFGFPYGKDGKKFESNKNLILSDDYASDIAVLELIPSPYAENRGILAVLGTSENTLHYADTLLKNNKYRNSFTKDCMIVDSSYNTKAYQLIADSSQTQMPTLIESLTENKQSVLFTLVATSVMFMLLIAVIIILIRIRMYHKKK